METHLSDDSYDPARALSDAAASREAVAARLVTPSWYYPILGASLGLLTYAIAAGVSHPRFFALCAVSIVISVGLARTYQRLTGLWVSPNECGPRARRAWVIFAVFIVVVLIGGAAVDLAHLPLAWCWALVTACIAGTIVFGRRFDAVLREEIRTGETPVPSVRR